MLQNNGIPETWVVGLVGVFQVHFGISDQKHLNTHELFMARMQI